MNTTANRSRGITLVELVVGMAILGVILLAANSLLQVNQRATLEQQTRTNALSDARAAITRMTENISAAAYIYPAETDINVLTSRCAVTIRTGSGALALLIPDGSRKSPPTYHGVIYHLADRASPTFAADLPSLPADRIAQLVLVEARLGDTTGVGGGAIAWAKDTLPRRDWAGTGVTAQEGVLVDGIFEDAAKPDESTHLMAEANFSPSGGIDASAFNGGLGSSSPKPKPNQSDALISSIGYRLSVQVATPGKALADSGTTLLRGLANPRNVPRR